MNPDEFFTLILKINNSINILKKSKVSIKDSENQDFRMKSVEYDSEKDEVYFYCEEDK